MSSWAERVHRRAADLGIAVTSCGHPGSSAANYPYRLEKVKFGVPLEEVCKNHENIPAPLLVLILKLNKESPNRRDVFRAPGHQGAIKKLIHFLQSGRLVNVENYSVYTIASVLKQFLRKIPNGIFGRTGERELFTIIELDDETEQNERLHVLFTSLPKYTQHLLVLLFGTFRVIASNAAHAGTGMTSEALGVSVAPSFFQSCVSDGKTARMEDVLKFKVATKIMKHIIDKFAQYDLFGRDNYEYYARVTGRILKVQDEWICSFQYPPPPRGKLAQQKYALQHSLEAEKTWLQCQCERWGLLAQEESRSTPALLTSSSSALDNSVLSLGVTPEHSFIESCARLSVSLEGPGLFAMTSSPIPTTRLPGTASTLQLPSDSSKFDFDEDNYADDDADYDDDEENTDNDDDDNFTPELDISHDDTLDLLNAIDGSELPSKHNTTGGGARQKKLRHSSGSNTSGAAATGATCTKIHKNASARQRQMAHRTFDNSGDLVDGAAGQHGDADDDGDDDDLNMTIVKRRYRQNKKKTTHLRAQQQRRLRSGSKSLDGDASSSTTAANANAQQLAAGQGAVASAKANIFMLKGGKAVKSSNAAANVAASATKAGMPGVVSTTRTCSRCNRGIRHSSSCSSNSGGNGNNGAAATAGGAGNGNAANGSGMTMEELRAVNRYAESTKSLSYLPQVRDEYLLASRISV